MLLLAAVVGAFFYLNYNSQKLDEEITSLNSTLAQQKTKEQKALEDEVLADKQRLDDFPILLSNHKVASEFFLRLEANTNPKITFSQLRLDPAEGTADLGGSAESFEALAQQLMIFRSASGFIQKVQLSKIGMNTDGKVDFSFMILLDPKVTTYGSKL